MSLEDDLAAEKEGRAKPKLQDIAIGNTLYKVEVKRLDGMDWAAVLAECPPNSAGDARIGFDAAKAALVACRRHSRLLDESGEEVPSRRTESGELIHVDWVGIFNAISGTEIQAIAALWWAMNASDPNDRVMQLKKASAGGSKTN